jgi:hypothetical protein
MTMKKKKYINGEKLEKFLIHSSIFGNKNQRVKNGWFQEKKKERVKKDG